MIKMTNTRWARRCALLAGLATVAGAFSVGISPSAAADGVDPTLYPGSSLPAGGPDAACGDGGQWVKFTSGGPNDNGLGEGNATAGIDLLATYTAVTDGDGLDIVVESLTDTDGNPVLFEGLLGKSDSNIDQWSFGLTSGPTPVLDGSDATNFTAFALCVHLPPPEPVESLTVTKTAVTSYDRAHDWSVTKTADPADLYLYGDGVGPSTGDVNWAIDVSYDGYQDSGWDVSGLVEVENTGEVAATVSSITDVMFAGTDNETAVALDCAGYDPALGAVLQPGDVLSCTYSQELAAAIEGTNTATVVTTEGSYTGSAPVDFGAPATETDAEVTISDVDSLGGTRSFGPVSAPADGAAVTNPIATFGYSNSFSWTAPGCSTTAITNTATLSSGDTVSAETNVHQQCFDDDTAWAAGARYTRKGSWATYVDARSVTSAAPTTTVTLYAGQTMVAGTVTLRQVSAGSVSITVNLSSPWVFAAVADNLKVEAYSTAPSGNPSPGGFRYKTTCDPASSTCSIVVPEASYYGIHVDTGRWAGFPA